MLIDCYGYQSNSERYQRANFEKKAYLVDKVNDETTYICFDRSRIRPIHRIVVSGTVTEITWALGAWEDRAVLDYRSTLNEPIESVEPAEA